MLAPAPVLALGFLGQEDAVEVSSAGRALMSAAEATKALVLLVPVAIVATWTSQLYQSLEPLMFFSGLGALAAAAFCAWFAHPGTLNAAFDHQRLVVSRETFALVRRLGCFWLSLAVSALDYLGLLLWGALMLATHSLREFAAAEAVQFAGTVAAIAWCFALLRSRLGELRLSAAVLALAGLPFYYLLKGLVALKAPSFGACLGLARGLVCRRAEWRSARAKRLGQPTARQHAAQTTQQCTLSHHHHHHLSRAARRELCARRRLRRPRRRRGPCRFRDAAVPRGRRAVAAREHLPRHG